MKLLYSLLIALTLSGSAVSCSWWNFAHPQDENAYTHSAIHADTRDLTIQGSSGNLSAILELPELAVNTKCPIVLLMHGLTSQKNDPLNVRIANLLKKRGIASIRFDFNGHGESEGQFQNMTVSNECEDALAVLQYANNLNYVSKVGIAGHSQGGLVCTLIAGQLQNRISAVVLMSAAGNLPDMAKNGNLLGVEFNPDNLPENGITLWRHNIGKAYLQDAQQLDPAAAAAAYPGPVCILHGTKDSAVPVSTAQQFKSLYKDSEIHIYEGDNHGFRENFDDVCLTAADFFAKHLSETTNINN